MSMKSQGENHKNSHLQIQRFEPQRLFCIPDEQSITQGRQVILTPPCVSRQRTWLRRQQWNSLYFRRWSNVSKGRDLVKNCISTFLLVVKPVEGGSHIGGKWLPRFDDLPAPTSTTSSNWTKFLSVSDWNCQSPKTSWTRLQTCFSNTYTTFLNSNKQLYWVYRKSSLY